jgi:hypothetical protein
VGQWFVLLHWKPPLDNRGPEKARRNRPNGPNWVPVCAAHGGGFPREDAR